MTQWSLVDQFVRDLRYGVRVFVRNPGFAAAAVLTLGLGIGANMAIFSVLYNTVLAPLPYADADRLMRVQILSTTDQRGARTIGFSYPKFVDLVRENRSFESVAAYARRTFTLTGVGDADRVVGEIVSAAYFPMLGVVPTIGRSFNDEEDRTAGSHPVAIVSEAFWRSRLGGRPDVIGRVIALNGVSFDVVGVAPVWFKGESGRAEVWIPMMMAPAVLRSDSVLTHRPEHWHEVVGRLRAGVSAAQADQDVRRVLTQIPDLLPPGQTMMGLAVPLAASKRDPRLAATLQILFGAVSFVVLIACVNLANILLARGIGRQREIAVRLSVGAGRWTIVRQLLTECLILSLAGAVTGMLFATWGLQGLVALRPEADLSLFATYTRELDVDAFAVPVGMWLFSLGLAVITTVAFGLVPALQASRPDVQETLKAETESWSARHRAGRLWRVLIASEVALVVVLLAAAGLMVRSFDRLIGRPLGIDPQRILTFRVSLPTTAADLANATAFFDRLIARVDALPGVESVARVRHLPIRERGTVTPIQIDNGTDTLYAGFNVVDPAFFRVFGARLISGRLFDDRETLAAPAAALISEAAARQLFGTSSAIGHRITANRVSAEIVGVIGNVHYEPQRQQLPIVGDVYLNLRQWPQPGGYIALRTTADPHQQIPTIRKAVAELDPGVPIFEIKTMEEHLGGVQSSARFTTLLLVLFALLALALAVVGIYGTLSYAVAARGREIAIRMALGADRNDVLALMLREGLTVCAVGVMAGVPVALTITRVMRALLYQVGPGDPLAFALAILAMSAAATFACIIPAHRAAVVNPVLVLRR